MRTALISLLGVVAVAATVVAVVYAATSSDQKIGGALCEAQRPGGVICRWPDKPWAVGVSRYFVFVWRKGRLQFVRTNN